MDTSLLEMSYIAKMSFDALIFFFGTLALKAKNELTNV